MRMIFHISFAILVYSHLIFSAMTLLIIQIMRSGLYTTVDDNLKSLSQNPRSVLHLALARAANMQLTIDEGQSSDDVSGPQDAPDPWTNG